MYTDIESKKRKKTILRKHFYYSISQTNKVKRYEVLDLYHILRRGVDITKIQTELIDELKYANAISSSKSEYSLQERCEEKFDSLSLDDLCDKFITNLTKLETKIQILTM